MGYLNLQGLSQAYLIERRIIREHYELLQNNKHCKAFAKSLDYVRMERAKLAHAEDQYTNDRLADVLMHAGNKLKDQAKTYIV